MSQIPNIISPCSRLNDDVLRQIFFHCIIHAGDPNTDYYSKNISTCFITSGHFKPSIRDQPQLSVSEVCSSWRDIALHTPQLWDNIFIGDLTEANLSTAREYLSRAKNLPVSIRIKHCTAELPGQDLRSPLIDFLSTHRIRTLILEMPRFHLVVPDFPQRSVAELESLVIYSDSDREEAPVVDLNDIRYPKFAFFRTGDGALFKMSSFNSRSLRIFDGERLSMTVIESWDLLSHCPLLVLSRLWITPVNGGRRPVSMPQIHLQRLRTLVLHSESEIPFSTFIEALSLPLLEQLSLKQVSTWSATAFQSLAHRSNYFPHLWFFRLAGPTSIVDVGILLASMPWLGNLSLCPNLVTDKIMFDDLALNGLASGSLAPRLQYLRVGCFPNAGLFLDMVESRMKNAQMSSNGVPALFKEVLLFDNDYRDRLRNMWERGIPVQRDYSSSYTHL